MDHLPTNHLPTPVHYRHYYNPSDPVYMLDVDNVKQCYDKRYMSGVTRVTPSNGVTHIYIVGCFIITSKQAGAELGQAQVIVIDERTPPVDMINVNISARQA